MNPLIDQMVHAIPAKTNLTERHIALALSRAGYSATDINTYLDDVVERVKINTTHFSLEDRWPNSVTMRDRLALEWEAGL